MAEEGLRIQGSRAKVMGRGNGGGAGSDFGNESKGANYYWRISQPLVQMDG